MVVRSPPHPTNWRFAINHVVLASPILLTGDVLFLKLFVLSSQSRRKSMHKQASYTLSSEALPILKRALGRSSALGTKWHKRAASIIALVCDRAVKRCRESLSCPFRPFTVYRFRRYKHVLLFWHRACSVMSLFPFCRFSQGTVFNILFYVLQAAERQNGIQFADGNSFQLIYIQCMI